jgi:thiamine kinase-like enzyme
MFFSKPCGPFPDYPSLSAFYNRKLEIAEGANNPDGRCNTIHRARPLSEPFDDSRPLVFTHGDLSMRNIIYGKDGRIWLVDLGMSGFYPRWFEYIAMVYAAEDTNNMAPDSWNRLIPFIADPLFTHRRWIDQLGVAFIAYR